MSERKENSILDIIFRDRDSGKELRGTLEFMDGQGAQMNFEFNEKPPENFDARFVALMALSEGMSIVGKCETPPKVDIIPLPPNDGILN